MFNKYIFNYISLHISNYVFIYYTIIYINMQGVRDSYNAIKKRKPEVIM